MPISDEDVNGLLKEINMLRFEISLLREGLKPFAEKAIAFERRHPGGVYPIRDSRQISHKLGDFRRAAALVYG